MIVRVALPLPLEGSFDYKSDSVLNKGTRVLVDFRGRREVGIVTAFTRKSSYPHKLKNIIEPLDDVPSLPPHLLQFCAYLAENYFCSYGEALKAALPAVLRTERKVRLAPVSDSFLPPCRGKKTKGGLYVREDFYGEKRFALYKRHIEDALKEGRQAVVCFSRWQDVEKAASLLGEALKPHIAYLSSFQSPARQFDNWMKIRRGEAAICMGTRLAVFAPFTSLGLIIVEKESFPGHYQPQKPFYNLRDIAAALARLTNSFFIMSSDAFSLASFLLVKKKKMELLDLREKEKKAVKIFDLRNIRKRRYPVFSHLALNIIDKYVRGNKKAAVFWRRKGFSRLVRCRSCGYIAECPACGVPFVYGKEESVLRCPRCDKKVEFFSACPACGGKMLKYVGVGEERAEAILAKYLPQYKIVSLGKENPSGSWNVAVGTQAEILSLAERPELVVISGVDSLFSQDELNASEEGFLLLYRLCTAAKEEAAVFTFLPGYYPFAALQKGEELFYKKELSQRKKMGLPPYLHMVKVDVRSSVKERAENKYRKLLGLLGEASKDLPFSLYELGYTQKLRRNFYYTLVLKAKKRSVLRSVWSRIKKDFRPAGTRLSFYLV